MEPTRGLVFEHTSWLDDANHPLIMRVTKIARGTVYYRPVCGGSPMCCDVDDFGRYARPVIIRP